MLTTNFNELVNHITRVNKGLFKNAEFTTHAQKAGDAMQKEVQKAMKNVGGMDYHQSYQLKRTMSTQTADWKVSETKANIGFGEINDLNKQTKRKAQRATFSNPDGSTRTIKLRPEQDLPSWIIMEFGRKGTSQKGSTVPSFIKKEINYSPREKKDVLFGPSTSLHMRAPIFFMTNKEMLSKHHGIKSDKGFKSHSGIREGKFFRNGLINARPAIQKALADGIEASLRANIAKLGGRGVVTRV